MTYRYKMTYRSLLISIFKCSAVGQFLELVAYFVDKSFPPLLENMTYAVTKFGGRIAVHFRGVSRNADCR